ncbi:MAG: ECF-type sigma factor, partial [Planctomycetota bacterium]
RGHFMALAANAMRQVLVDHARAKRRVKRGGAWGRAVGLELDALAAGDGADDALDVDLLDLEDALVELAELSPRQARTVELRFFGGLDEDTIAGVLGVSTRTVRREWRFARAWLVKRIGA